MSPTPRQWLLPASRSVGLDDGLDPQVGVDVPGGTEDPEYGIVDPAAGVWWPEQAKSLVRNADPALEFNTVLR
ncbi:hypothetical protein ABZY57_26640 [Streptomyces sp. NPDC006450]|uniref:hypothetical protein n=1 Tax=Streptomyces sp. NPDC006450 TaxID=3155458 RepID=UPI0033B654E5